MIEKPLHRYSILDSGSLCKLFRSPDVYIPSSDDNSKPGDVMDFIDNALRCPSLYALGRDPRFEAFIFAPAHNGTTYHAHFAVREDKRDGTVVKRTAEAGKWVFENTKCHSIISYLREDNKGARSVVSQVGMSKIGKTKETTLIDGAYRSEIIYEITVDEFNAIWGEELGRV